MTGRPIRFLATAMGGWTLVRVGLLWPTIETVPDLIRAVVPGAAAATPTALFAEAGQRPPRPRIARVPHPDADTGEAHAAAPASPTTPPPSPPRPTPDGAFSVEPAPPRLPSIRDMGSAPATSSRLAVSLWGIARQGVGGSRFGSQLGGSQAGMRATWRVGRGLALSGRASSALDGTGREVAAGIDWQPLAMPLHFIAERRIPIDGGAGGTALFTVIGMDPRPLAAGFRLEAYGQAGVVLRARAEPFADGAARLMRTVARRPDGRARLEVGAGLWGGAQRGAARLDIGPAAALVMPLDRQGHALRLTLDWRQRIAGDARPGSGPALSIGADL